MRADVFVRRLIERVGLRRHRLFAATPETAERLVNLSRLAELAADWSRREPRGSVRDFVRHLTAVAEAGELGGDDCDPPAPGRGAGRRARAGQGPRVRPRLPARAAQRRDRGRAPGRTAGSPTSCSPSRCREPGEELTASAGRRLAYVAMTRAGSALVLSWPEPARATAARRRRGSTATAREARGGRRRSSTRRSCSGPPRACTPPTGCSATRCSRRRGEPGSALSEMRLDTADDVNAAVARYLELIKLAALIQRPGAEPAAGGARRRSTSCSAGSRRRSSARRSRPRRSTTT